MSGKRRRFTRGAPVRNYRKLYIIVPEGEETEPEYFRLFMREGTSFRLQILSRKKSSAPLEVFNRARQYFRQNKLRKTDSVWLILDRDAWSEETLNTVWEKCQKYDFKIGVSNPCFEYWLLLHFENGKHITTARNCRDRLKQYIPEYTKKKIGRKKLLPNIQTAINHAREKDVPPCTCWPCSNGSTVYRLVLELVH